MNLFDILKNISESKENLSKDPEFKKAYNPFMINRYLSMHPETIVEALFMAENYRLTPEQHYHFLFTFVEKKSRYFKYEKKDTENIKDLEIICKYYAVNEETGKDIIERLDPEAIKMIKASFGSKRKMKVKDEK